MRQEKSVLVPSAEFYAINWRQPIFAPTQTIVILVLIIGVVMVVVIVFVMVVFRWLLRW